MPRTKAAERCQAWLRHLAVDRLKTVGLICGKMPQPQKRFGPRGFVLPAAAGPPKNERMTVSPLGDAAVVITLGETVDSAMVARVRAVAAELERHPPAGVVDITTAFASVALFLEPLRAPSFAALCAELEALVARADAVVVTVDARTIEIPICYGGSFGPDLSLVAEQAGLSIPEVIALHAGGEYLVHALGFTPGFPYLGGLPPRLASPRRATPRPRVPAGSVAIGGAYTGVYPLQSPGGWNLIGRTPLALFDPRRAEPALLRTGDSVKFKVVAPEDFEARGSIAANVASDDAIASAAPGIEVLRGGMLTTIQDLGRRRHRGIGVPLSGAADAFSLRLLNSLVGNLEEAAALEFTLVGPTLRFLQDAVIAIGGGDFGDVPRWRPLRMAAGTELAFGPARSGCRGYLAIAGGVAVPPVLGSRSTYLRAALGGIGGRALRQGDLLPVPRVAREFRDNWRIDERILPAYSGAPTVRVIAGMHVAQFDPKWMSRTYTVSMHSDRMGARLSGAPVARTERTELLSGPVAPGTVQVPPDGQPIVLLADAQTIGGYPQLCHVISVDLPLVAQLRPGDTLRFECVTLAEAHERVAARERALGLLHEGLAQKLA
jgi:KipI family sensor histidine kinase inhibitor